MKLCSYAVETYLRLCAKYGKHLSPRFWTKLEKGAKITFFKIFPCVWTKLWVISRLSSGDDECMHISRGGSWGFKFWGVRMATFTEICHIFGLFRTFFTILGRSSCPNALMNRPCISGPFSMSPNICNFTKGVTHQWKGHMWATNVIARRRRTF